MTKILQFFFTTTLVFVLLFWCADILIGVSTDIGDRAVAEGWAEQQDMYEQQQSKSRFWTLAYAAPTLCLLIASIRSIRQKNDLLFYSILFIGLTIFQILPTAGLLSRKAKNPSFLTPIILTFSVFFLWGQIFSLYKILQLKKKQITLSVNK